MEQGLFLKKKSGFIQFPSYSFYSSLRYISSFRKFLVLRYLKRYFQFDAELIMHAFLTISPFHVPAGNCFSLFINPRRVYTGIQEKLKENASV